MKVRVLKSLIYAGNAYDKNEKIEILDIYANNLISRKLVEEIKEENINSNQNMNVDTNVDENIPNDDVKIDLTKLKVEELKKKDEEKAIEFDSKIKKEELIELITEFDNQNINDDSNSNGSE